MNSTQDVIALQTWWLGELKKLTAKVMQEEDKRQLKVRSKTDALLADFQSKGEILDAYGFGCITEKQKDRLMDLWDKREDASFPARMYGMKLDLLQEMYETAKGVISDSEKALGGTA